MAYRVVVADNFHYLADGVQHEVFATLELATEAARRIVDEYLASAYVPGMGAEELFRSYTAFGEDPYVVAAGSPEVIFSAWGYARERCRDMCGSHGLGAEPV